MIKVVIIEDEPAIRKEIEWLVNQHPDLQLSGIASNVQQAVSLIQETQPQLALMDIQLADGNAFHVLDQIEKIDFKIIFITAYNNYAIKAIKYGALDYLLKPIDEEELSIALTKVRADLSKEPEEDLSQKIKIARQFQDKEETLEQRLVLHTMEFIQVVLLKDIIYCQSEGSYTTFFLTGNRKVIISKPLKYYEELLPEQWFLRSHQSFLVNIEFVDKILKTGYLLLKDGTKVPISLRKKEYIFRRITEQF